MSAKMSAARRAAFLRALEETGNVTLSAERSNVSRAWVCAQRRSEPEFDRACRAAVEAAKAGLARAEGNRPPSGWGHLDGVELVVRGTKGRRVQIARARAGQWTASSEDRFLQVFAATCNAKAAYAAAGKSKGSAYGHRRRWPGFARRWGEAEWTGYMRLEDSLFTHAANLFSSTGLPPECPMPPMTVAEAIQLLRLHRHQVDGVGRPPGRWRPPLSLKEVEPRILRIFSAVARERGLL